MHDRRTHNGMSKMMFPWMNMGMINKVNHAIDHPTREAMMANNVKNAMLGPNAFVIPGMYMQGHRQYNHDMLSAYLTGYSVGGPEGGQLALAHLMEDMMRTQWNKSLGYDGANLMEAAWNYALGNTRRRHHQRRLF